VIPTNFKRWLSCGLALAVLVASNGRAAARAGHVRRRRRLLAQTWNAPPGCGQAGALTDGTSLINRAVLLSNLSQFIYSIMCLLPPRSRNVEQFRP
jgi:hypothetical protein